MDHSASRRLRLVKIRLSGHPDDVDQVARVIAAALPSTPPSPPYSNRRNPATVRVYLEASPE